MFRLVENDTPRLDVPRLFNRRQFPTLTFYIPIRHVTRYDSRGRLTR